MNIKEFANMMQKNNEKDKRWSILCFITFIFTGFVGVDETTMLGKICFPICGSIMIIFFTMHYLKRYLSVMFYVTGGTTDNDYIYNIAKTQAFQPKKYFEFLRKKLIVWEVVFFVVASAIYIIHTNFIGIVFAVIMGLIPLVVCLLWEKRFNKEICTRNRTWEDIVGGIFKGIISVVEVCIIFFYMLMGYLFVWAVISDVFVGRLDENTIIYKTYENEVSFEVMFFAFIILVILCMFAIKKRAALIRVIMVVIFIVSGFVEGVMIKNQYTEIYEDKIIVCDFEEKKEYLVEEIESFKIYEENGDLQVKVTFTDGFSETLFGGVSTNTEAYDEKYYSIYHFMEKMIPVYMEHGAKGEIDMESVEELREIISGYDKEIRESFERIVEIMNGEKES